MSVNLNINAIGQKRRRFPVVLLDGNTVAWYDSQLLSTITKDGSDFVSQVNDRLGSGNNISAPLGTNEPKWFSVNGILHDGIDNFLQGTFTFNQPESIYLVVKQITWSAADRIFDGKTDVAGLVSQLNGTPNISAFAGLSSGDNGDLPLDTFAILRVIFNGASSKLQINDNTAVTGDFGASNMGGFTIGTRGSAGSNFGHIQWKEAILRKVADSANDQAAINNYLANKHGI